MTLDVAVLVSVGRHPISGRARRADNDARAVEMALDLRERHGARLHVIHAGYPDELALRDYLGMGVSELTVLALGAAMDPFSALCAHLRDLRFALLLTGMRAERGPSSGQLPYALAEALGSAIVAGITEVEPGRDCAEICQALPRGRRRALSVTLPAVLSVARTAAGPRQSAFGRARRGLIIPKAVPTHMHIPAPVWPARPARILPTCSQILNGADATDRLRAIREAPSATGQRVEDRSAIDAACLIHAYLQNAGVLRP